MILSWLIALPFLSAILVFRLRPAQARLTAVLAALVELALCVGAWHLQPAPEFYPWIPALGIHFSLRLDGLSVLLLGLTALLTGMALVTTPLKLARFGEYCGWMLVLSGCLQGVFLADNLGLFYVFWEIMILPAFMLVGRWGGEAGRKAAFKFFLYTLAGSLSMLLALVVLAFHAGQPDLGFQALRQAGLPPAVQLALLLLFLVGFCVKIPLLPLHGWQPDTYEAAPAPVAVVLAGAMSKAGLYGVLRVGLGLFPLGMSLAAPWLGTVGLLTVLYGTLCALGQTRTRRVIAYSSQAHMGMMTLGVCSLTLAGWQGSVLLMVCHGLTTGGLLLLLGYLEDRDLPTDLDRLGGLSGPMPLLGLGLLFFCMAALGLPGLCSFPGELLVLTGVYSVNPAWCLIALLGLVGAAWYMLRFFQRVANGEGSFVGLNDLSYLELSGLLPLVVLVLWLGVKPHDWVQTSRAALEALMGGS